MAKHYEPMELAELEDLVGKLVRVLGVRKGHAEGDLLLLRVKGCCETVDVQVMASSSSVHGLWFGQNTTEKSEEERLLP